MRLEEKGDDDGLSEGEGGCEGNRESKGRGRNEGGEDLKAEREGK